MKGEAWRNRIAVAVSVAVIGLWAWWLFRPVPSPFVLRAKWKVQGFVDGLAFSPKGDLLAVAADQFDRTGAKSAISLWKVPEGRRVNPILVTGEPFRVFARLSRFLAFSPDGHLLAVGYREKGWGKVGMFRVADGQLQWTFKLGKTGSTPCLAFSPDGRWLAVKHDPDGGWPMAKQKQRLVLLRVADGKPVRTLHAMIFRDFAFSPDSLLLAFSQFNLVQGKPVDAIDIMQVSDGKRLYRFSSPPHFSPVAVNFSKDGARLWVIEEEALSVIPPPPKAPTFKFRFLAFRLADGKQERSWGLALSNVLSRTFALSPDERFIALPEPDPSGWHGLVWRLEGFMSALYSGNYHPTPPTQVTLRSLSEGKLVAKLPRFKVWVGDFTFSPDGRYLAVGHIYPVVGSDSQIVLWERKGE